MFFWIWYIISVIFLKLDSCTHTHTQIYIYIYIYIYERRKIDKNMSEYCFGYEGLQMNSTKRCKDLQQHMFTELQTVTVNGNWLDSLDPFIESITIYSVWEGPCSDVIGYITICIFIYIDVYVCVFIYIYIYIYIKFVRWKCTHRKKHKIFRGWFNLLFELFSGVKLFGS